MECFFEGRLEVPGGSLGVPGGPLVVPGVPLGVSEGALWPLRDLLAALALEPIGLLDCDFLRLPPSLLLLTISD